MVGEAERFGWHHDGTRRPPFAVVPAPGQESVWDYPRPPTVDVEPREVIIGHAEAPLSRSTDALTVRETASPPTVYVPMDDIDMAQMAVGVGTSVCEWKGQARYWELREAPGRVVAWEYPRPRSRYGSLLNRLAFYPGRIRCVLGGEVVRAQPGGFYGGWVTSEIVGPFKGEPGTAEW